MPVRSLNSSVLKWPDLLTVRHALQRWVKEAVRLHPDTLLIGYFGSYARGDWGVGSDLDLIIVVESSGLPFEQRSAEWDTMSLPVPTDVLVYTLSEWADLDPRRRFARMLRNETIWLHRGDVLAALAREALADFRAGRTEPLDPDNL
ncbi:MAG: nucleotidyltransferase domain-containing protein [Gemmatimonadetes bacterium]|nr:nucleotidyltransferase domain-containing protein [Gemmatimonadota bacterium]